MLRLLSSTLLLTMEDIRAFIALDVPDEIKEKIGKIQSNFREFKIKLVDPSLIHITLKFLGNVPEEKIKSVTDALDKINFAPFVADICEMGVFPNYKRIRVIWIGSKGNFEKLQSLVESLICPLGFEMENRPFSAHLTIARVKNISNKEQALLSEKIKKLSNVAIGEMNVDRIKLKKSTLTKKGPIYEDLYVKELKS